MRLLDRIVSPRVAVLFAILALAACTARLVPAYDKVTYQSLTTLNADTLALFSALSRGASPQDFSQI